MQFLRGYEFYNINEVIGYFHEIFGNFLETGCNNEKKETISTSENKTKINIRIGHNLI